MKTEKIVIRYKNVLDPLGETTAEPIELNDGIETLDGKVIGLLDNAKPNADETVNAFKEFLSQRYDVKEWIYRKKPLAGNVAPEEVLSELAEKCDAVITAHCD